MRWWVGAAAAAVVSCSPQEGPLAPAPIAAEPAVRHLDQGWSAADRATFYQTRQGSYLMRLPWFMALRRLDTDASFAGDQLRRYGYLPTATALPVGFVADGSAAEPYLGMTCAACHTGQLRIGGAAVRIEGGRAKADFQRFLTDLRDAAVATDGDPARFDRFAASVGGDKAALRTEFGQWVRQFDGFMTASLPQPAWGAGRLDAFGMIFNRVTGLDLKHPENVVTADAPVRYPFIWDAPRQDHTQWTGAAPNGTYLRGLARNTGEVFGVFGRFDPVPIPVHTAVYNNDVNLTGLQTLEEKVVALKPPRWADAGLPIDGAKAARGAALFASACASCHAARDSKLVSGAWDTPVRDVGTDPRTFARSTRTGAPGALEGTREPVLFGPALANPSPKLDILANAVIGSLVHGALTFDPAIRQAIRADLREGRLPLAARASDGTTPAGAAANVEQATRDLYKLPNQTSGAAYEARVLTGIWAVGPYLHNGSVPTLYDLLTPAAQRPRRFAVGHEAFDPVKVGLETGPGPERTMFTVDPAVGNGNGGHEYGTALPDADRWDLVEYLKTL